MFLITASPEPFDPNGVVVGDLATAHTAAVELADETGQRVRVFEVVFRSAVDAPTGGSAHNPPGLSRA